MFIPAFAVFMAFFLMPLARLAATLVLGVPTAYDMVKKQNRWTRLFEELLVTPLAIPGLAIALALIICYGGFTGFRKSWAFIWVGHVIYTLPFMVRSAVAVMNAVNLTHDQAEAMTLGNRIVVMNIARVAQVGAPREIYFDPRSRFVAEFIGSINRLKGQLRQGRLEMPGAASPSLRLLPAAREKTIIWSCFSGPSMPSLPDPVKNICVAPSFPRLSLGIVRGCWALIRSFPEIPAAA